MRFYLPTSIRRITVLAGWTIALAACEGRPARKTLPDLTSLQGWEDMPLAKAGKEEGAFFIRDTTIMEGSRLSDFLSVFIPDPANDSLVISMATTYEPFAGTLVEEWAGRYKKGIMLDLRTGTGHDENRADFLVKKSQPGGANIEISLVFIWNQASAYRFDYLIRALTSMPEIHCSLVSESRLPEGVGRTDCFSPSAPGFDQP